MKANSYFFSKETGLDFINLQDRRIIGTYHCPEMYSTKVSFIVL